jgi:hypothetical protein
MPKVKIILGKEFGHDYWCISLRNKSSCLNIICEEGYKETMPYAGIHIDENEILELIDFLVQTLREKEENG